MVESGQSTGVVLPIAKDHQGQRNVSTNNWLKIDVIIKSNWNGNFDPFFFVFEKANKLWLMSFLRVYIHI